MDGLLGILGKVGFDWQVALANLFNFLIIFLILRKFAFKPIGKLIKERQDAINKGIENAEKNANLLENTKKDYEKVLLEARTEASNIIQEAKKEANTKKEQLIDQTKNEINLMLANSQKALEVEKEKMLNEAKKEIVDLVMQVSGKVMGQESNKVYLDKVVKELKNI